MDIKNRLMLTRIISRIHQSPEFAAKAGIVDRSFMIKTVAKDLPKTVGRSEDQ